MAMRVNARLDDESSRQLQYLLETTQHAGVSDVLKASLEHYYAKVRAENAPRLTRLLALSGTQGSGRSDVSVRAKEFLTEALSAKG
jgi:hypothetical protein